MTLRDIDEEERRIGVAQGDQKLVRIRQDEDVALLGL